NDNRLDVQHFDSSSFAVFDSEATGALDLESLATSDTLLIQPRECHLNPSCSFHDRGVSSTTRRPDADRCAAERPYVNVRNLTFCSGRHFDADTEQKRVSSLSPSGV